MVRRDQLSKQPRRRSKRAGGHASRRKAITVRGDVTHEADVLAMFDAASDAFGTLCGVVVNAGIVAPSLPLADMAIDRLKRMFDVNIFGATSVRAKVLGA